MSRTSYLSYQNRNRDAKASIAGWTRKLNSAVEEYKNISVKGMTEALNIIGDEAIELTPEDTGDLRNSQYRIIQTLPDRIVGVVGYLATGEQQPAGKVVRAATASTDYAPFVHEIPVYQHASPTQWRFLTTAFARKIDEAIEAIASTLRKTKRRKGK